VSSAGYGVTLILPANLSPDLGRVDQAVADLLRHRQPSRRRLRGSAAPRRGAARQLPHRLCRSQQRSRRGRTIQMVAPQRPGQVCRRISAGTPRRSLAPLRGQGAFFAAPVLGGPNHQYARIYGRRADRGRGEKQPLTRSQSLPVLVTTTALHPEGLERTNSAKSHLHQFSRWPSRPRSRLHHSRRSFAGNHGSKPPPRPLI